MWNKLIRTVESLTQKQKEMEGQYYEVCRTLKRTEKKVEKLEDESAVQNQGYGTDTLHPLTAHNRNNAAKRDVEPPKQNEGERVTNTPENAGNTMNTELQSLREGREADATQSSGENQTKKNMLNWAKITKLNIKEFADTVPTQPQEKFKNQKRS